MPTAKTTQQDPTITNRLARLRTALFNVALWKSADGTAVCFCEGWDHHPCGHSKECQEAADALGLECRPQQSRPTPVEALDSMPRKVL